MAAIDSKLDSDANANDVNNKQTQASSSTTATTSTTNSAAAVALEPSKSEPKVDPHVWKYFFF